MTIFYGVMASGAVIFLFLIAESLMDIARELRKMNNKKE